MFSSENFFSLTFGQELVEIYVFQSVNFGFVSKPKM